MRYVILALFLAVVSCGTEVAAQPTAIRQPATVTPQPTYDATDLMARFAALEARVEDLEAEPVQAEIDVEPFQRCIAALLVLIELHYHPVIDNGRDSFGSVGTTQEVLLRRSRSLLNTYPKDVLRPECQGVVSQAAIDAVVAEYGLRTGF